MNEAKNWNDKGVNLYDQGKYDDAVNAYDEAIRLNPNYAEAFYNKGIALADQDKYNEAFEAWDEAIRLDPNFTENWSSKGYKLYIQGRYDEAIKAYRKAISINVYLKMAWNDKAAALDAQGKNDEANEAYDKVEKITRQIAEAFYNKGIALAVQGKNDEANRSYCMAIRNNLNEEAEEERRKIVGPDLEIVLQTGQDIGIERQLKEQIEQELLWQNEQRKQREHELKKQGSSELAEEEWRDVQIREQVREAQIGARGNGELERQKEQRRLELEEKDWRKEHQVSSELGDYDLLQYRCEKELETGPDDFLEDEQEEDEHSRLLRFATLEMVEPQSTQEEQAYQANLLRVLLVVNGGKIRAEDARREMHLTKELFSLLLASMGEYIETKPYRLDETELVIILKSNFFSS